MLRETDQEKIDRLEDEREMQEREIARFVEALTQSQQRKENLEHKYKFRGKEYNNAKTIHDHVQVSNINAQ